MAIIGETFNPFVDNQINIRQLLMGKKSRSSNDLLMLNNTNAWLKLASSVRVLSDDSAATYDKKKGEWVDKEISTGEQRLRDIGLPNTGAFTGKQLAQKSVLFNTLSSVSDSGRYSFRSGVSTGGDAAGNTIWNTNSSYGLGGTDFGIQPAPGLISAKIDCKNRGSIREATIELKAYNKFQFELIELLYLRLGYTMMLEWGWDKFFNNAGQLQQMGNTIIEELWFDENNNYAASDVIKKVDSIRAQNCGNYDGFVGKVVNFNWKFSPDGTYDITLKLITVGDVIESLKINNVTSFVNQDSIDNALLADTEGDGDKVITKNQKATSLLVLDSPIITNAGNSTLSTQLFKDIVFNSDKWKTFSKSGREREIKNNYFGLYSNLNLIDHTKSKDIITSTNAINTGDTDEDTDPEEKYPIPGVDVNKYNYFITLGGLLTYIETYCIPTINGKKMLTFDLSTSNICSAFPYQVSFDPRICLIKPDFGDNGFYQDKKADYKNDSGIHYFNSLDILKPFLQIDENSKVGYGNTNNIYLNYDFISEALKKNTKGDSISIFKFLEAICEGINSALGGVQNLEPIIQNDSVISIIDQNPIPGIAKVASFKSAFKAQTQFEIYGFNNTDGNSTSNFVKSFGFDTKIGPELASMITIGAVAEKQDTKNYDGTAFSKWNAGLKDQYQYKFQDPEEPSLEDTTVKPEWYPITTQELAKMYDQFDRGELDEYGYGSTSVAAAGIAGNSNALEPEEYALAAVAGAGILTSFINIRHQRERTYWGLTGYGYRDVDCKVTGQEFASVEWDEYCKDVQDYKKEQIAEEQREQAKRDREKLSAQGVKNVNNYISWLVDGFGGKLRNKFIDSNKYFYLNSDFIKLGKNMFTGFITQLNDAAFKADQEATNTTGFIPMDLSITIQGLSGVKIYNALSINQRFLPKSYPNALNFIVTKVNHDISSNNWETSLHTISTANVKDNKTTFDSQNSAVNDVFITQAESAGDNYINEFQSFVDKTPWSAVFVSTVVNKATKFPNEYAHTDYAQAIKADTANIYPWTIINPAASTPKVGDVIIQHRNNSKQTFEDPVYEGSSHGDIVTKVENGLVYAIGGNLGDSSKWEFTRLENGKLPSKYFVILRPSSKQNEIANAAISELKKWRRSEMAYTTDGKNNNVKADMINEQDPTNFALLKNYYDNNKANSPALPELESKFEYTFKYASNGSRGTKTEGFGGRNFSKIKTA
mgnify:FL=1